MTEQSGTQPFAGGCQCGATRYWIEGKLCDAGICHCRMCQKAFGSWGAALVKVPLENLRWTRGSPARFKSSPIVERGFCAACGTPLFMHEEGDNNIEIAIGTLDDPNAISPMTTQDGIESRLHWFDKMHTLSARTTAQTRNANELAKLKSLQHPDHDTKLWPLS
jgi:hypothetical protein